MYSFLKEGEFLQINLEQAGVTGYISREGDMESDRGQFLDQFFSQASVRGHDVSFTTKAVHGVWFEFQGKFARGPAKTKAEDAYYILRGTLTEFRSDAGANKSSRSREVEFKWLGQPQESGGRRDRWIARDRKTQTSFAADLRSAAKLQPKPFNHRGHKGHGGRQSQKNFFAAWHESYC